jgi:hypothetical protein
MVQPRWSVGRFETEVLQRPGNYRILPLRIEIWNVIGSKVEAILQIHIQNVSFRPITGHWTDFVILSQTL